MDSKKRNRRGFLKSGAAIAGVAAGAVKSATGQTAPAPGAPPKKNLKELIAGRKFAADPTDGGDCDRFGAGLAPLPADFTQLRWSLTAEEIQRYREGGRRTSAAIEAACRKIARNMTELRDQFRDAMTTRGMLAGVQET